MRLGIARKGLIVVAVPLMFQLLFLLILSFFLWDNFEKMRLETHARNVLFSLNEIYGSVRDAATSLASYKSNHDDGALIIYDKKVLQVKKQLKHLKHVVGQKYSEISKADREKDMHLVDRIEIAVTKVEGLLEECKQNLMSGNQFVAMGSMPVLFKVADKISVWSDELRQRYEQKDEQAPKKQMQRNFNITLLVLGGTLVNIIISLTFARFFGRAISNRLIVLADNSSRLAKGLELNPPVSGNDEINELDQSFRKMSEELKAAQEEQKALTASALASEERTRCVIENMPIGIVIIDAENRIESLNPQAEQMFGSDTQKLLGHPLSEIMPKHPAQEVSKKTDEFRKGVPAAAPGAVALESDAMARRVNGELFPAELHVSKFSTQDGKHFLVTIQDVTERHEMEKLKREFVSMVSHDLRTPLTAVQGTLDLLEEDTYGALTEQGHKRVKVANESIDRLINLINDLLDVEKMEAGKMRLEAKPTSLLKILTNSVESVRTFAERHEVELELILDEDLVVSADRDRMIQVAVNLLSNAVKFSPAGAKVSLLAEKEGQFALVRVIDRGRGIPQEHVDSLFQRFKQVKAADGARKKGTGLGLAICKAIVESHNGSISVSSEEGKGSEFRFTVPLVT